MVLHFNPVIFFYSFRIERRTYISGTTKFSNDSSYRSDILSGYKTGATEGFSRNEYIVLVLLRLL